MRGTARAPERVKAVRRRIECQGHCRYPQRSIQEKQTKINLLSGRQVCLGRP